MQEINKKTIKQMEDGTKIEREIVFFLPIDQSSNC